MEKMDFLWFFCIKLFEASNITLEQLPFEQFEAKNIIFYHKRLCFDHFHAIFINFEQISIICNSLLLTIIILVTVTCAESIPILMLVTVTNFYIPSSKLSQMIEICSKLMKMRMKFAKWCLFEFIMRKQVFCISIQVLYLQYIWKKCIFYDFFGSNCSKPQT